MRHPGRCCLAQRRLHKWAQSLLASLRSSRALSPWKICCHGWEWRENFGMSSSKCRGWFGTEAKPCWWCCSIPPALIQRFLWKHRCSALQVQVAMALLISICRECCGGWGLDGGQGNSPCVRWQRRAAEKEREGTRRSTMTSQSHTAVRGGSQAPACSLSPLTCLLDCATRNKNIFSLPRGDGLRAARGDWHFSERLW